MPGFDINPVEAGIGANPPPSPIETIGALANTRNAINANKMFPLQYQQQQLQNVGADIANRTAAQTLAATQYALAQHILAQTANPADALTALAQAGDANALSKDFLANLAGGNVAGLTLADGARMREEALNAVGTPQELSADRGVAAVQNTGGVAQVTNTRVLPGGDTIVTKATGNAAALPMTRSPSENSQLVGVVGPDGVMHGVPVGSLENPTGTGFLPGVQPPVTANPKAVAAAAAVGGAATNTYQYIGTDGATHEMTGAQLLGPDGKFKPNVMDAAGNHVTDAHGALQVGLGPQATTMLTTTAQGEADRANQLQAANEGSPSREAMIKDLIAFADSGATTTGPGATQWADIVNEVNRVTGSHFDANAASTTQVINKMAEQIAQTQISAGGIPRSNAGLESAELTSPGANYSPETIHRLAGVLQGNEEYIQKKTALWEAYQQKNRDHGKTPDYNTFISGFNKYYDPRAFWEPHMTTDQRNQMLQGMSPEERKAYDASKQHAADMDRAFGVQ